MQSAMLKKPLSACRMHLNLLGRARVMRCEKTAKSVCIIHPVPKGKS